MEKHNGSGLQANQKTQGVWERITGDRRLGQNQLFGSFRVNPGARVLNQSDPTDDALAAIASILNKPTDTAEKPPDTPIDAPAGDAADEPEIAMSEEAFVASQPAQSSEPSQATAADGDTYVKYGPGPLDVIRLKWSIRPVGDGTYFIDETIGDSSRAVTSGPMPKPEAIRFVDQREEDARRRFDALKNEMTGQGAAAANPTRSGAGGS